MKKPAVIRLKKVKVSTKGEKMRKKVRPVPKGYHSVTPSLVCRSAKDAIKYYKKAFGAEVTFAQNRPDGKVMHAALRIGDSMIMLADECAPHEGHEENCVRSPQDLKGTTTCLYLYVDDVDAVFKKAIKAGSRQIYGVTDMFWGDRMGVLKDPFGFFWTVATHTKEVGPKELKEGTKEFFSRQETGCD
jgi:PhnB protein